MKGSYDKFDLLVRLYLLLNLLCALVVFVGLFVQNADIVMAGLKGIILFFTLPTLYAIASIVKYFIYYFKQ
jgi:hypothetical protein